MCVNLQHFVTERDIHTISLYVCSFGALYGCSSFLAGEFRDNLFHMYSVR